MATDSSHLVIMGKILLALFAPAFLIGSSFLQVRRTTIKSQMSMNFGFIQPWTAVLAALECLKNSYRLIMGEMLAL